MRFRRGVRRAGRGILRGVVERLCDHASANLPELFEILFDPAGVRIVLCELRVGPADDGAILGKDEYRASRRALIQR